MSMIQFHLKSNGIHLQLRIIYSWKFKINSISCFAVILLTYVGTYKVISKHYLTHPARIVVHQRSTSLTYKLAMRPWLTLKGIIHCVHKKPNVFFAKTLKTVHKFPSNLAHKFHAEQCVKTIHFTCHMYTYYLAVLQDGTVTKHIAFSKYFFVNTVHKLTFFTWCQIHLTFLCISWAVLVILPLKKWLC